MADYRDIFSGTIEKLAGKVKEAADSSGVLDAYTQGTNRAIAYGQIAKLTLELSGQQEELKRVYTEIGRLYFEQAGIEPTGLFVPLFEKAQRINGGIQEKRARIDALKRESGAAAGRDIDADIVDFDDVVSATEADGMTVENKTEK